MDLEKVMKAIVYTRYGPPEVLQFRELQKPTPKDNEILVKVIATTVTVGDTRARGFRVPLWFWIPARIHLGIRRPKRAVLGMELAGEVESAGRGVKRFKKGDRIFACPGHEFGSYAEYVCLPEDGAVATMPSTLTYEEAAGIPLGGLTALHFLRKGNIHRGQKVLIYGASGSVGTFAVQLAKHFGAQVTGVCSSTNVELVKSLGADRVVDYTKEDFTLVPDRFELIFDAAGKISYRKSKRVLAAGGKYVSVLTSGGAKLLIENLVALRELADTGKIRPIVDRCYPWEQIIEAHRYVDGGHKRGNVVICLES